MASYPRTAKQAEREFLEALRLEPDNADLHYQFGLYYKAMKQRRARSAEMQTAVRLNRATPWPAASWRRSRPRTAPCSA